MGAFITLIASGSHCFSSILSRVMKGVSSAIMPSWSRQRAWYSHMSAGVPATCSVVTFSITATPGLTNSTSSPWGLNSLLNSS